MRTWIRWTVTSVFLLVMVPACDDGVVDTTEGEAGVSEVSLYLTDAPGDVEAVWVDVTEVYLQGGPGGRTVLLDEPTGLIELTALVGTTVPLVQDEEVPEGSYGQLRVVIGGAVLEAADGSVFTKDGAEHPDGLAATGTLQCPSCSQTGIKVLLPGDDIVLGTGSEDFLLDFDVTQSFGRQAGQSGQWVMRPVIHGARMIEMGQITGTVTVDVDAQNEPLVSIPECPAGTARGLEDFIPTATAATLVDDEAQPIVRTGFTSPAGAFQILGLVPDGYDLGYIGELEFELEGVDWTLDWTATVAPASVVVAEGETVTGVEYTITGATCNEG